MSFFGSAQHRLVEKRAHRLAPSDVVTFALFSEVAAQIAEGTRAIGLAVPGFQSLPANDQRTRVIRRTPAGSLVLVRIHGRLVFDVVNDLVDGVLWINGDSANFCSRPELLAACGFSSLFVTPGVPNAA
jgi:hypothetical protein